MTREELTTIIGLLEKVENKRLAAGVMWSDSTLCYCAQGAICPRALWEGEGSLTDGGANYARNVIKLWADETRLSVFALRELEVINDTVDVETPEERYQAVMKELKGRLG